MAARAYRERLGWRARLRVDGWRWLGPVGFERFVLFHMWNVFGAKTSSRQTRPANPTGVQTPRALSVQAPMHSSNGLTLTCRPRPRDWWVSDQDFKALREDGYICNSTEFCKVEVAPGSSPTLADMVK
eukprot:367904-Prymnesium_polylepis.1